MRADGSGSLLPRKGRSTREAKRICLGCEVKDACLSTPWPTTSASASGAACPSGNAVAQARHHLTAQSANPDRRVDHRRLDTQIRGHLSHQDVVQIGEIQESFDAPLNRLAEQHDSRPGGVAADVDPGRDQPRQRDRAVGHHLRRELNVLGSRGAMRGISSTATSSLANRSCHRRSIGS